VVELAEPKNVTRFAVVPPILKATTKLRIGGRDVALPARDGKSRGSVFGKENGRWVYAGDIGDVKLNGKRPGLQGPIDDAFTSPFLCVRGTGKPWNPAVQAWSEATLQRFAEEWRRYFRGELPVKDDTAVTDEDVRNRHVILFGDPGSNRWIAKALPQLPLQWSREKWRLGGQEYRSAEYVPVMIQPSPFADGRYVVLDSGHTFHEKELSTLNYLLFPRLGDWAVIKMGGKLPGKVDLAADSVERAGYFDEQWQMPGGEREKR
jgi:hypothetical protein